MSVKDALTVLEKAIPEETKFAEWKPIRDSLVLDDPPAFPIDALPNVLRDMALGISMSRKVPVAMAASTLLSAVGIAIGRNVYFYRKRGFEGRANLYTMVFAARGERKSVTFKPVLAPFFQWMKNREPEYRKALRRDLQQRALLENLDALLCKPGISEVKRNEYQKQYDALEEKLGDPPRNPRFIADDVTPEALFKLMKDAGGTAGIFSDDARLIVKMLLGSVYSKSGESREDFLLRPFDGEQPSCRHRVSSGNDIIERPCIGMLLMLQTDFLKKIGMASAFFESGLASRCLFCYPESWVGKRDKNGKLLRADDDYEIPLTVEENYGKLITRLLDKAYVSVDREIYTCSPEALDLWRTFYHEIEEQSGKMGKFYKTQDLAIRYPSQAFRLALQLTVLNGHKKITQSDMANGIELMRYYMASAERCYLAMREADIPESVRSILRYWQKDIVTKTRQISIRQLQHEIGITKDDAEKALKILIERNYCRPLEMIREPGRPGREASPRYEINPQFFEW